MHETLSGKLFVQISVEMGIVTVCQPTCHNIIVVCRKIDWCGRKTTLGHLCCQYTIRSTPASLLQRSVCVMSHTRREYISRIAYTYTDTAVELCIADTVQHSRHWLMPLSLELQQYRTLLCYQIMLTYQCTAYNVQCTAVLPNHTFAFCHTAVHTVKLYANNSGAIIYIIGIF